jgi:hypothetical protein
MMPFVHGTSIGSAGKPLDWQGATVNLASTTAQAPVASFLTFFDTPYQ